MTFCHPEFISGSIQEILKQVQNDILADINIFQKFLIINLCDLYGADRYFPNLTYFDLYHITYLTIDSCYISYESYNDILPKIKGNGPAGFLTAFLSETMVCLKKTRTKSKVSKRPKE